MIPSDLYHINKGMEIIDQVIDGLRYQNYGSSVEDKKIFPIMIKFNHHLQRNKNKHSIYHFDTLNKLEY